MSSRAMCHPSCGDTCHLGIGPTVRPKVQICLTHVVSWGCHMLPVQTCHVSHVRTCHMSPVRTFHVIIRTCHVSVRTDCTDYTVNNFLACLTFRTECDIFSIRTSFDKVNIPPKSGRRDGCNGVGFVAF
jgi:hypothetical protein